HELTVIEDKKGKIVTGKQGNEKVTVDASIDEVGPDDFDALFIPGGFSPDQLRADDRYVTFARAFMSSGKPVFAICHGPQLLITAKTLEGRKVTGFTSIQVDLEYAGAEVYDEAVVNCRNQLITSRNPNDIPTFNRETLRVLQ